MVEALLLVLVEVFTLSLFLLIFVQRDFCFKQSELVFLGDESGEVGL